MTTLRPQGMEMLKRFTQALLLKGTPNPPLYSRSTLTFCLLLRKMFV